MAHSVVFKVLQSLASPCGKVAVFTLNRLLDKVDPETKNARTAFLLHCTPFDLKNELQTIHSSLEEATVQLKQALNSEMAKLQLMIQHRDIDSSLHTVNYYLILLLRSDKSSREYDKKEFLRACKKYDPKGLLAALREDVNGDFLKTITDKCDYQSFLQWCDKISLCALRAYLSSMHRLYVMMEDEDSNLVNKSILKRENQLMLSHVKGVLKAVKQARNHYETRIFIAPETGSTELMQLIDDFLVGCDSAPKTANQNLADKLGADLSVKYPWYTWAVIIAEDNPKLHNFVSYSDDFQEDLFIQESIHQQLIPFFGSKTSTAPVHKTVLPGKQFGIVTCKRKFHAAGKLAHQRRLTVFWTKPDEIVPLVINEADKSLLEKVNVRKLEAEFETQNMKERRLCRSEEHASVEEVLFRNGYQYMAYLGLNKSRQSEDFGICIASEWPYHIKNEHGHLFLWLTNVTQKSIDRNNQSAEMQIARDLLQAKFKSSTSTLPQSMSKAKVVKQDTIVAKREPSPSKRGLLVVTNETSKELELEVTGIPVRKLATQSTNRANRFQASSQLDHAAKEYEAAVALLEPSMDKRQSKKRQKLLALAKSNLAFVHLVRKNTSRARELSDDVLQSEPSCAKSLFTRSMAYMNLDTLKDAGRDLREFLKLEPERKDVGVWLKIVELLTISRSSHESDLRKDVIFWSILPGLITKIKKEVNGLVKTEPTRRDADLLLSMMKILSESTQEALEAFETEQEMEIGDLLVGWLDMVLLVVNDMLRFKKEWLMERDYVQLSVRMVGLVIAAKRALLENLTFRRM